MSDLLFLSANDDRIVENADWVELSALIAADSNTSQEDFARAYHQAKSVSQQFARDHAKEVFRELADRASSCGNSKVNKYPFTISDDSLLLSCVKRHSQEQVVYKFLLLVTRADMSATARIQAGIDATKLFEGLCEDILRSFWGDRGQSGTMIIGTAKDSNSKGNFRHTINNLCSMICEGEGWKSGARTPRGGDGGLDVAAWRRFSDNREGSLVGFAQCKTGDNWRKDRAQLQPRAFCGDYMVKPLLLDPIRIYMVPHRITRTRWESDTRYAGLLFDRCRITEFASALSRRNLSESKRWLSEMTKKAKEAR